MKYGRQRQPGEIEAEIARVRREMDATLSAIEGRLTTDHLVDQGLAYLRQSGGREFVSNLGTSVKQNPLSVTLVGIGLAWLMISGKRGAAPTEAGMYGHDSGAESAGIKERAGEALGAVSATAASAKESVSRSVRTASQKSAEVGANVRYRARQAVETTRRQAVRARRGFDHMLNEQPLVLGMIGLAVGAAVAAAVPRTRQEDEWMGEARDRFAEKVKETGHEQLENARHVASAAAEAAVGEGSRQQQTPSPAAP